MTAIATPARPGLMSPRGYALAVRPPQVITAATTAVSGDVLYADTSGGAVTVTLPLTALEGDRVDIIRVGTNAVTIDRNGHTIGGSADDVVIDSDNTRVALVYINSDWLIWESATVV